MSDKKECTTRTKIYMAVQFFAGLLLVVFGLNKFFHFIAMVPGSPEMGAYMGALFATGFMFPLIAVVEILAGIAFMSNKFAALMAIVVLPVMINAFLAHALLDPAGIGGALVITIAIIAVMFYNKDKYAELFKA